MCPSQLSKSFCSTFCKLFPRDVHLQCIFHFSTCRYINRCSVQFTTRVARLDRQALLHRCFSIYSSCCRGTSHCRHPFRISRHLDPWRYIRKIVGGTPKHTFSEHVNIMHKIQFHTGQDASLLPLRIIIGGIWQFHLNSKAIKYN